MFKACPFVQTRYCGPTDRRRSYIKAWNVTSKKSIKVHWDSALNEADNHEAAARQMFDLTHPWFQFKDMIGGSVEGGGFIFTFNSFKPIP